MFMVLAANKNPALAHLSLAVPGSASQHHLLVVVLFSSLILGVWETASPV